MQSFLNESRKFAFQYNETVAEQLRNICSPVFENFGIKNFNYNKMFFDGRSILNLSTNMDWNKYFFSQMDKNGELFQKAVNSIPKEGFYYFLWPITKRKEDHILSAYYDLNMRWGLTIYRRGRKFIEAWNFTTNQENEQFLRIFVNHRNILERFIPYFNERASDIINLYPNKNLFIFKEKHNHELTESNLSKNCLDKFIEQTPIKKYPLRCKTGQIYLSKRESECLFQLSLGKTAKEIGRLLNLSPRTVEFYINNIKEKTGCRTRTELVRAFNEYAMNRVM